MKTVKETCDYKNMRSISIFGFIFMAFFIVAEVSAAPSVTDLFGTINNGSNITVSGTAFGTKATAAPVYWNNLENETTGSALPGWDTRIMRNDTVTTADKWSGSKSLYFAMKGTNRYPGWSEIRRDMGASPKWYFHFKVRLNKNDSNTQWQWKAWRISSSSDGYAWNTEDSTALTDNDWWWRSSTGWFNVSTFAYYNNSGAAKFTSAYLNASDAIKFNEWQTLEEYAQMSSAPLVADGITKIWRNGTNILSKTDHVTHDAGSGVWRYLLLGQAIESTQPVFGTPDFDIYYDDIYIDNTQSRVMICDASSWSTRTQCEVQIPVTWADNSITFTLNTGRFTLGQVVYIYVIDSNGVANTAGYNCKLGAPLPPKNFIKVP